MELGSVAELISGFGTLAALLAASVAAKAAIQTNRQQGKQLNYLEDAERRRQVEADQRDAANIAVWTGIGDEGRPAVRLVNNSGLPTYDLTVWMTVPGNLQVDYQVHGPTDGRILRRASKEILQWADGIDDLDWARFLADGQLGCAATFRDASNRWWLRDFNGALSRRSDKTDAVKSVRQSYRDLRQSS